MLTAKMLKELSKHIIFATGVATDNHLGLFMSGSARDLRWVAVTGEVGDWAIYCHFADKSIEWIRRHGDKVGLERNIKMCVKCDESALLMYRR